MDCNPEVFSTVDGRRKGKHGADETEEEVV